jgi:thioredoxin-dependent peroxiredoxin
MANVGEAAPDFELIGADRKPYRLSQQIGQPIVLAFYRGDDTEVCSRQLDQYNRAFLEWRQRGIKLFGISPDEPVSHFSFGCRLDLAFPLLSDTDKSVARSYKVPTSIVGYGRSTFVLDQSGKIHTELRPRLGGLLTYPSVPDIDSALNDLLA